MNAGHPMLSGCLMNSGNLSREIILDGLPLFLSDGLKKPMILHHLLIVVSRYSAFQTELREILVGSYRIVNKETPGNLMMLRFFWRSVVALVKKKMRFVSRVCAPIKEPSIFTLYSVTIVLFSLRV